LVDRITYRDSQENDRIIDTDIDTDIQFRVYILQITLKFVR